MANEQGNPYAPPAADVNAGPAAGPLEELPTAGMGARLLNFIIDYVVQLVLGIIVVMVIRLMGASADWSETTNTVFGLRVAQPNAALKSRRPRPREKEWERLQSTRAAGRTVIIENRQMRMPVPAIHPMSRKPTKSVTIVA